MQGQPVFGVVLILAFALAEMFGLTFLLADLFETADLERLIIFPLGLVHIPMHSSESTLPDPLRRNFPSLVDPVRRTCSQAEAGGLEQAGGTRTHLAGPPVPRSLCRTILFA